MGSSETNKTITIKSDTWSLLSLIKNRKQHKNFDETIRYLFKKSNFKIEEIDKVLKKIDNF